MTTPAPQGGAGSDDSTGRPYSTALEGSGWEPSSGHQWKGVVRTSFSNGRSIDSCDDRECRLSSSRSWSRTLSTEIEAAGAVLSGAEATGGANAGRNSGRKRGLAPRPDRPEAAPDRATPEKAVAGRCCAGRCGAVLDPRRLTVRSGRFGAERPRAAVSQGVRCGADAVRFAVDAVCCGALGCRVEEPLLSVTVGGDSRVLCPDCAAEFVRRRSQ